jgi:membrane protease YdiL (CAAX protease family)
VNGEGPEREPLPPLLPRLALAIAALTGLIQGTVMLVLAATGLPFGVGVVGMAALLAYGAAFALCIPRIPQPPAVGLALLSPPRIAWLAVILLAWSLILTSEVDNLVKHVFPVPEGMRATGTTTPVSLLPLLLVSVFVYPLTQELLFRGALQPRMIESLGRVRGILFTALLNAVAVSIAVFNPWAIAPTAANALLLGVLRETSGSLLPSLLLHVLWGLVGVGAAYGAFGIPGFDDLTATHTPLGWLVLAALFTGAGLRLCRIAGAVSSGIPGDPGDDSPVG